MQYAHFVLYSVVALVLLTGTGNVACRKLFEWSNLKSDKPADDKDDQPAGWIIGWLERLVLAIGIVYQSWEVIAAVIALKTVARFKDLDDRKFAEYFLVGSLFSILWTVIITGAWLTYDRYIGIDLRTRLSNTQANPSGCVRQIPVSRFYQLGETCELSTRLSPRIGLKYE